MTTAPLLFMGVEELRREWGWLLALGIVLVLLGTVALVLEPIATVAAVMVLGWLMVISGVVEAVQAFRVRGWGGVFLHLAGGILGVLVGLLVVTHPLAGALALTLLFSALFTVMGLFRTVAAIRLKYPNWGWAVFDGLVTLALGILLWAQWPTSAFWFLGFAVGVSLILRGWSNIMFAIAVRSGPSIREVRRAA
jgi:uncharacterized membrane protein HdeD (DUF308 family)